VSTDKPSPSRAANLRRILVPTDFSEGARAALDLALSLAEVFEARVDLLHVWELPAYLPSEAMLGTTGAQVQSLSQAAQAHAEANMHALVSGIGAPAARVDQILLEVGSAAPTIVEVARTGNYDLIVIGTHGRSGISRLVAGSVTERVVRSATCPVLSVRAPLDAGQTRR